MVDRLISVGDDLILPPSVKVEDANLPTRLGATELSATYFNQKRMAHVRETTIPAGIGWGAAYGLEPQLTETLQARPVGSVGKTALDLFNEVSTADSAPGASFTVSYTSGLDTNPGTYGSPFKTIYKAIQAANASGVPTRIVVMGGSYPRGAHFDDGTGVLYPTVDISFQAYGRVIVGTWDEAAGFVADTTYPNTWVKDVANCDRVIDLLAVNKYGNHVELTNVNTPALANATPNGWVLSSGKLYIHRANGAAPSAGSTQYFREARNIRWTTNKNIYFGGDGFDFRGGAFEGALSITGSGMTTDGIIAADNCSFRWAGASSSQANGISINNRRGLAAFFNCRSDANAKDGFNVHNNGGGIARLLTVNCQGLDNGRRGTSCNGWTLHEDCIGIDIAGVYMDGHGGTIHNIGSSKAYLLGTYVSGDAGDLAFGGGIAPSAIKVGDTSQLYAERVVVDMPANEYAYVTSVAGAGIHRRDCAPTRQPDYGPGTFDTF